MCKGSDRHPEKNMSSARVCCPLSGRYNCPDWPVTHICVYTGKGSVKLPLSNSIYETPGGDELETRNK